MRRAMLPGVVAACVLALVLACFGPVLFLDRQFSYRDAGSFYYPLHERVQQEWDAGRWPLWEPEENGGTPLLGNPSAAVLYPGKILYALPYAWAARLYVIAHVVLAFTAMLVLLRSWLVSGTGSSLGAIAYAFGAPILFQYCNVIFLVGAAWAPLGLLAVDRLVRLQKRRAVVELAAVLALQVLGGDPEAAYLVVLCGIYYAWDLERSRGRPKPEAVPSLASRRRRGRNRLAVALAIVAWVAATLTVAALFKTERTRFDGSDWLPSRSLYQMGLLLAWTAAATWCWVRWRKRPEKRGLLRSLAALGGASVLALGLSAAQLLPVVEFSRLSVRASEEGRHNLYHFSLEPYRLVEWLWPGFFGTSPRANHHWLPLVPPAHGVALWVPSCYLGGLTLLLAATAIGFRGGPPWRRWLAAIALGSVLGALGQFSSPVWWARSIPGMETKLGPHDPTVLQAPRADGGVSDGDGGVYWMLTASLPFFRSFRYPSKLLAFASLALAALSGLGWDRLKGGHARPTRGAILGLLGLSVSGLIGVSVYRQSLISLTDARVNRSLATYLGPFDPQGAVADLQGALGHGSVVLAGLLVLTAWARRGSRWAGPAALAVLSLDLAWANAPLVVALPQAQFDRKPELLRLIDEAEAKDPAPGPFRVHRMLSWSPPGWLAQGVDDRIPRASQWLHDTINVKGAIPYRHSYTLTRNTIEFDDYWFFFSSFSRPLDARRVELPGARPGQGVAYHPRRAYDLWNTRYFILPLNPNGWDDDQRGIASFMSETELIAPDSRLLDAPENQAAARTWLEREDWQLRRNKAAYPRAWVVHQARRVAPSEGPGSRVRPAVVQEILYGDDPFWSDPGRPVYDPHELAWLEVDDFSRMRPFVPGGPPDPGEQVAIVRYEPQRVELDAHLRRPGIVVLADLYYPGWTLTIDGQAAPILRTNWLMRGAAVAAGRHRLVYKYEPLSFRLGGAISLTALAICGVIAAGAGRGRDRVSAPECSAASASP